MGRTYLFLSGKGGTGKTTLSTSLGIALARKGKRTVLVDAELMQHYCIASGLPMGTEEEK